MEQPVKGTVTPLSSIFPPEEARKASKRVYDTISERRKELDQLQEFITDNTNLVNLVQKLPDELHHEIMVPLGKAAFFPGRLIHTNEFLVLLGEGYYADRTAKQTIEILKRRGKSLESQVVSFKAVMQDLKEEASHFDAIAAESAEGLVEIREDYLEESSSEESMHEMKKPDSRSSEKKAGKKETVVGDDEYASIMARIDELEKEELEAKKELEDEDADHELNQGVLSREISQLNLKDEVKTSEAYKISSSAQQPKDELSTTRTLPLHDNIHDNSFKRSNVRTNVALKFEGSNVLPSSNDSVGSSLGNRQALGKSGFAENNSEKNIQAAPSAKDEAFTGSIVERTTQSIERNPKEQSAGPPSKPVSRFKMQRR